MRSIIWKRAFIGLTSFFVAFFLFQPAQAAETCTTMLEAAWVADTQTKASIILLNTYTDKDDIASILLTFGGRESVIDRINLYNINGIAVIVVSYEGCLKGWKKIGLIDGRSANSAS